MQTDTKKDKRIEKRQERMRITEEVLNEGKLDGLSLNQAAYTLVGLLSEKDTTGTCISVGCNTFRNDLMVLKTQNKFHLDAQHKIYRLNLTPLPVQ